MASFSRKTGIVGALALAGVLISGAYLLSDTSSFLKPSSVDAESTQALLQAYAQKDSDGDGLPDWEEALYGTDPHNAHSVSPTLTDGEAVAQGLVKPKFTTATSAATSSTTPISVHGITAAPNSLTDQFAQNLFGQYISQANGTAPSDADIAKYAQSAIQTLVQNHSHQDVYTLSNEHISNSNQNNLNTYAVAAENALAVNTVATDKNEIDYFSSAVNSNDPGAIKALVQIGKAYTADGPTLMAITVPQESQYAHLELANSLMRLGEDVTDMSTFNDDPLRAYLGLAAYQQDSQSMLKAFTDEAAIFNSEQVTIKTGQAGYSFYNAIQDAAQKVLSLKAATQ